ncbi:FtsX-like permease family protein [Nitrogeniibacter mangrovi]|uniref:FtsX-like permease family protein n=1 Tax=Nitrogeniibacter mangrovi TaxID=2016596 RepID=A0A6C1B7P6_9RHOO|nr:ABC transporter permease [Nitrogeniibacter mangrovi]QID18969.1 FtsX-like permease family protein [Nitrogeniibacter mangrovi]
MGWRDFLAMSTRALVAHRMRSFLTLLGIAVGIAAVILLTSIGEGIHQFVLTEFTQFGTNVVAVNPGSKGIKGGPPGLPNTARPLTLEDARALERIPGVTAVTPAVWGNAEVEGHGRVRRSTVYGVGPAMQQVFTMSVRSGRFLPADNAEQPRAFAVLGSTLKRELFGHGNALGERVRIGGERFRVIGVMESKGQLLGIDLDDTVYIPTARGLALFNRDGLLEIDVSYREGTPAAAIARAVERVLDARHGRKDFSTTTQEDMLEALGNILDILTAAVGALGGISLLVGGVGIVTIMTIAVTERTGEIGLLVALGARRQTILGLFLGEAVALAALGGACGLVIGIGLAQLVGLLVPDLPVHTPLKFVVLAEITAVVIGLLAGVLPARKATTLDPVEALRAE